MRVSKRFKLGLAQPQLDFVDVDIARDTPLYIDPRALRLDQTMWGQQCVSLLQDFFAAVLAKVQADDRTGGIRLLSGLHEPNETHLGDSKGRSQGSAIGDDLAEELWDALSANTAVRQSGLLRDLEDSALLVDGIGRDRISDIATNVLREPLIHYTQAMSDYYGIKRKRVPSPGPIWSPAASDWTSHEVELPVVPSGPLLLVPKSIVRAKPAFNYSSYFQHGVLPHLQSRHLDAGSELVELLKNGKSRVTKVRLKKEYGAGKPVASDLTKLYPQMLDDFRHLVDDDPAGALSHEDLALGRRDALPDWDAALAAVASAPLGKKGETEFHHAVESLLTMLLHGSLAHPSREHEIHDGRKRIDVRYSNVAPRGFFAWLSRNYPAAHVVIECKNYSGDPANPELDQISGRFSPSRGQVGFLVCRSFKNKDLFWERCRDTAKDRRGYIIPLDDSDLADLVDLVRDGGDEDGLWAFFKTRFDRLED